jgi:hypothetical protein
MVAAYDEANKRNETMTKPIHHAIVKRATKLGVNVVDTGDGFRIEHKGRLSVDTFDAAKEAVDLFAAGGMEFEARKGNFCGVMVASYHDRYEHNVHGPGSCDGLDIALRDEYTDPTGGVKRDELQALGEELGLWNPGWVKLNNGMVRMNLSNRIRAWLRNNADAKLRIGKETGRFGVKFAPSGKAARRLAKVA